MTSTAYLPRHAESLMPTPVQDEAFELIGSFGDALAGTPAELCSWRAAAFDLLMRVKPARVGRHRAPESAEQIALIDGLLDRRSEYLAAQPAASLCGMTPAELPAAWDGQVIALLGMMGSWS